MSLGDKRLSLVLDKFTDRICQRQHLSLRRLAGNRNEEIQFGRFIANQRVEVSALEEELYEQFRTFCPLKGHILLIEDTSQMAFSLNRKVSGLGKVDKGQVQGFYLHPVLGLDADNGACYGIASVAFLKRVFTEETCSRKQVSAQRDKTAFEEKEGYRWYSSIVAALAHCPQGVAKTVVADREADIYPVLTGLQQLGVDYLIRCRHNRPLEQGQKLYERVQCFSEQYCFSVPVPATDNRSAHTAMLKVRFGQVELKKPATKSNQDLPATHTCWVVKVEEDSCSVVGKEQPIEWLLLTSHQVDTVDKAWQLIDYYKLRWNIEQVFSLLKSKGLCFEASQVKAYEKLKKLMLLALRAAVRILQMVRARDGGTNQSIASCFSEPEQALLIKLNHSLEGRTQKLKNPYSPRTLAFAAWVIARLSGWSGYQSQRPPAPIDFFVGLQRFEERYQGYSLANAP